MDTLNRARRRLVVLELVIDLQPVALGVGDDEPVVMVIEDHRCGIGEPPFAFQAVHFSTPFHRVRAGRQRHLGPFGEFLGITSKTGDNLAIGVEDLDAVVGPVAYIDIALGVDRYVGRTVQLALSGPIAPKLHDELAIGGEFLHAVVLMIRDVHVSLLI